MKQHSFVMIHVTWQSQKREKVKKENREEGKGGKRPGVQHNKNKGQ